MKYNITFIFVSVCLFLTNCEIETEIEYPIRYQDKKLFITGFIGPSSAVEMEVGQVIPPLAEEYDPLKEIKAELFKNDVSMGNIQKEGDNFFYQGTGNEIAAGDTFHVKISAEGIETARSNPQVIPQAVKLDSISYFLSVENDIKVFIYFTDPPGTNYYSLHLKKHHASDTTVDKKNYIQLSNTFTDKEFNESAHRIIRDIDIDYNDPIIKIDILLFTTTKEVYNFYRDLSDFEGFNSDIFVQPVIIESNIQNGEGIFGAYNFDMLSIEL